MIHESTLTLLVGADLGEAHSGNIRDSIECCGGLTLKLTEPSDIVASDGYICELSVQTDDGDEVLTLDLSLADLSAIAAFAETAIKRQLARPAGQSTVVKALAAVRTEGGAK